MSVHLESFALEVLVVACKNTGLGRSAIAESLTINITEMLGRTKHLRLRWQIRQISNV